MKDISAFPLEVTGNSAFRYPDTRPLTVPGGYRVTIMSVTL